MTMLKKTLCATLTPLVLFFQNTYAYLGNLPNIEYVNFSYGTQEMKHTSPSKHQ